MKLLQSAKIAVAGIGGVGCIAVEMLARQGVGNIKVADIDVYKEVNLNRQIFATVDTLGQNKAIVARERILDINPNCNVQVFEKGVNKDNVYEFLNDVDILLCQVDKESIKVLLHKVAKEKNIPVICGSRDSLENSRWCVVAKLWDYKNNKGLPCYDETNHPELMKYSVSELSDEFLAEYDKKIAQKMKNIFKQNIESNPESFKSISQNDLKERLKYNDFTNRHVCSVLANTGGCLAVSSCIRYILGAPIERLEQNLW